MSKVKNYCFTLNNFSEEDILKIKNFVSYVNYMIFGEEEGDKKHTKHLQGFIQLKNRMTIKTLKNKLGIDKIHLEKVRGTVEENISYCSKDNNNIFVYGEPVKKGSNSLVKSNLRELIKQCNSKQEVLEIEGVERHYKFALEYFYSLDRRNKDLYKDVELREWQKLLIEYIDNDNYKDKVMCRDVLFVIDRGGGKGKSFLCSYLGIMRDDVFVSQLGRNEDVLYIYKDKLSKNILLDTQRDLKYDNFNWKLIENITNRFFTSSKYESKTFFKNVLTNTIIFTNNGDIGEIKLHLSLDRIKILDLDVYPYEIDNIY